MGGYSDKCSSESEDMGSQTSQRSPTPDRSSSGTTQQQTQQAKTCVDCGTSKTPLWRGGPDGPKSLCNACGIRSRKRRRALLGLSTTPKDEKRIKKQFGNTKKKSKNDSKDSCESTSTIADSTSRVRVYGGDSMRGGKLLVFGRDVALQRPRSKPNSNSHRRRLGEEEEAAFLLMSLSRGCVFA